MLAACARQDGAPAAGEVVLARVGTSTISAAEFEEALQRLGGDRQAQPLEKWREQLQVLIDKHLLLAEARRRHLQDDPQVERAVAAWERNRLADGLLRAEMGAELSWSEGDLQRFFDESGAGSEIRLQRLDIDDRQRALDLLDQLRAGISFAEAARRSGRHPVGTGWLNPLGVEARYAPLFLLDEGDVELVESGGKYLLIQVAAKRQVPLAERRQLAEAALARRRRQEANLAYLARLAERYAVQLDTSALARALADSAGEERVLKSRLGEWTYADYQRALARLQPAGGPGPASVAERAFRLTRAYVAAVLLREEARRQGWYGEVERDREKVLEQKMIEALWQRDLLSQVRVDAAELRAFYRENEARYAALSGDPQALRARLERDLREERAAPLFEEYMRQLRQQMAAQVHVDEGAFQAFVARMRQGAAPIAP